MSRRQLLDCFELQCINEPFHRFSFEECPEKILIRVLKNFWFYTVVW